MVNTLVWSIASVWLTGYQDVTMIGEFRNQQQCLTAFKEHRPNWEVEPSVMQCVQVKSKDLHEMKNKELQQYWLGVQR